MVTPEARAILITVGIDVGVECQSLESQLSIILIETSRQQVGPGPPTFEEAYFANSKETQEASD